MTPVEIEEQRRLGWPDFHPEDFCHKCGRPNIRAWFSPEWEALVGSHSGILCPVCFAALDPGAIWTVTRWTPTEDRERAQLVDVLRGCTSLGDDAERVAGCVLDAGFRPIMSDPNVAKVS